MVKNFLVFVFILISQVCFSQIQEPVKWNFSVKKITPTTYEVHLAANIDPHWHLYSQSTPDGGPVATVVTFAKNPLVTIDGKVKEIGRMEQKHEPLFGVDVKQFSNKVDFVQVIKLKKPIKTNISGSVEFMVCDDTQCLPPSTQKFSLALK
jgi:thiol:disulfide interchange protein DsbD